MKLFTQISLRRKSFLKPVKYILWLIAVMTALFRVKSFTITPASWSCRNQVPEISLLFLPALFQFRRASFTSMSLIYKHCVLQYKGCKPNRKSTHLYHDFTDVKCVTQAKINQTTCQNVYRISLVEPKPSQSSYKPVP